jgi:hypothetical protein
MLLRDIRARRKHLSMRVVAAGVAIAVFVLAILLDRALRPDPPRDVPAQLTSATETRVPVQRNRATADTASESVVKELHDTIETTTTKPTIVVNVRTEAGTPIPNAQVEFISEDGQAIARRVADAQGVLEYSIVGGEPAWVVVGCRDFATRMISIVRDDRTIITVTLKPDGEIKGRVHFRDGTPPPAPMRVMVSYPRLRGAYSWNSVNESHAASSGDLRVNSATTDGNGAFRIRGVEPGTWCTLVAGGAGVGPDPETYYNAEAGGESVDIIIGNLYILDVLVEEEGGRPLSISPLLRKRGEPYSAFTSQTGSMKAGYPQRNPVVQWSGASGVERENPFRQVVAYWSESRLERFGPITFSTFFPGYYPTASTVWALPVGSDTLTEQVVLVKARERGFGEIRFLLDDVAQGMIDAVRKSPNCFAQNPAVLVLKSKDTNRTMCIPLSGIPLDSRKTESVPCDDYTMFIEAPFLSVDSLPSIEFSVIPGTITEVVLRMPGKWAALEFDAQLGDSSNCAYSGPLALDIEREGNARQVEWAFSGPPYLVAGVDPGRYRIYPSGTYATGKPMTVDLAVNAITRVVGRMEARDLELTKK